MRIADSTALRFTTGSEPGRPRHVGQTCVFGSAPNSVGQPQNILVFVSSSTCTSSPSIGSKLLDDLVEVDQRRTSERSSAPPPGRSTGPRAAS